MKKRLICGLTAALLLLSVVPAAWAAEAPADLNTVSTTTAPPSKVPTFRPATVVTGMSALRSTWRSATARGVRPLAWAVRTKSWRFTSSIEARVRRAKMAT